MKRLAHLILIVIMAYSCNTDAQEEEENDLYEITYPYVLFEDSFGSGSLGDYRENIIQLPPPEGLGITWNVLPGGYRPVNWILGDECGSLDPKRGFWVIPDNSAYLQQAGRSHNSVFFANVPVPGDASEYEIEFSQYRVDNDKIMFVLGAEQAKFNYGKEFGYMIQYPGTDSTTTNAYLLGEIGNSQVVEGVAFRHAWANHKIIVNDENVQWFCNDMIMAEGKIEGLQPGYVGIRHRYERNTMYDDFKITVTK